MKFLVKYKTISWTFSGSIKLNETLVKADDATEARRKVLEKTKFKAFNITVEEKEDA